MKKIVSLFFMGFIVQSFAQLPFTENFDSYVANSFIGISSLRWTTFSGLKGGVEDAKISSAKSFSGNNSLYLGSTVEVGGPTDIILPLSSPPLSTGTFSLQFVIFVEGNKGAQINIHGDPTLGAKYTVRMEFQQATSGTANLRIFDATGDLGYFLYQVNQFVPIKLVANLNNSKWDVYIGGLYKGSFYANETDISALELFPVNNSPNTTNFSGFYIDDITASNVPFVSPARNASLGALVLGNGLAGKVITPKVRIRNVGTTAITTVNVGTNYNSSTKSKVVPVSLAVGEAKIVDLDTMSLAAGLLTYTAFITSVNGVAGDDNKLDDTTKTSTNCIAPAPNKIIVAEEATGTWCQWCPRGAVYMDFMNKKYDGNFVGIAVHNKDPMTHKQYDSSFAFIINGYPSAAIDRLSGIDPSSLETSFLARIGTAPKAKMELTGSYDSTNKQLKVTVTTEFIGALPTAGTYKLAVALTEYGVTGTAANYNQQNTYSGGKKGVMGGFELKSNPVPASDMIYDFVARDIVPSFDGKTTAFPVSVTAGQRVVNDFIIPVNSAWVFNNLMANALLIDPAGKIDNGSKRKAMDLAKPFVGVKDVNFVKEVTMFPNPSSSVTYIRIEDDHKDKTSILITDLSGKVVFNQTFEDISNKLLIPIVTENFDKGMYLVIVKSGGQSIAKKLIVE